MSEATLPAPAADSDPDRHWFIIGRWQEFEGETIANVVRIAAVVIFYAAHAIQHYWYMDDAARAADEGFHRLATYAAAAGILGALAILICLRQHIFPPGLKYASTAFDLLLITSLAWHGQGPASPLVFAYFLVIALAGLRFSLELVWLAAVGGMLGYVLLLAQGHPDWFGWKFAPRPTPVVEEICVLGSLALCGIALGQIIRRVRALAEEFNRRLAEPAEPS